MYSTQSQLTESILQLATGFVKRFIHACLEGDVSLSLKNGRFDGGWKLKSGKVFTFGLHDDETDKLKEPKNGN